MNNKKIVAGLLALTFVLGGTALPNTVVNNSVVASASEEESEVLRYGDYKYKLLEDGTAEITSYHFYDFYKSSDTEIEIPAEMNGVAVTSIGENAFSACREIKSIVIPDGVKTIGVGAFEMCNSLESIVIPDSVTEIKDCAFAHCESLESVTLSKNLKYIGSYVFKGCSKINSIVIPDGAKLIGESAFIGLDNLETIVIPDSVEYIGERAFFYCTNLKSIILPEGLKQISFGTFMLCESLESIVIPDSVESIDDAAFEGCIGLKSIKLSKGLKMIRSAFGGCESLENFVIPDSVKTIEEFAFSNCHNLKSITIPASVTEIGEDAFSEYDTHDDSYKPLKNVTINCYSGSYAEKYAKENGLNYKLIDEKLPNCPPPKRMVIKAELSEEYHQIRLRWKPYDNAEKYGIAVYLSGKWRVWTCSIPADVTVFTSPKNLTPGKTYKVAVAARVNGEWNVRDALFDAVTVTVK